MQQQKQMKILAIDTASPICSAALKVGDKVSVTAKATPKHQQSDEILPLIKELLEINQLSLNDLNAIAFAAGPGSFTGVRLAASIVQGLAIPSNLDVVRVSSFYALASHLKRIYNAQHILTLLPAKRNEFYCTAFSENGDELNKVLEPKIVKLEELPWYKLLEISNKWQIIKDSVENYCDTLDKDASASNLQLIWQKLDAKGLAEDIAILAEPKIAVGDCVKAKDALPIYFDQETFWQV